jgi:hypothetical protein
MCPGWTGYLLEARVGIEPTSEGFADLSLTTWVPRPSAQYSESRWAFQRVISNKSVWMGNCVAPNVQPAPIS